MALSFTCNIEGAQFVVQLVCLLLTKQRRQLESYQTLGYFTFEKSKQTGFLGEEGYFIFRKSKQAGNETSKFKLFHLSNPNLLGPLQVRVESGT